MRQLSNALRQVEMTAGNMESDEEKEEKSSGSEKGNERILTLEQMEKKMMKAAIKRNRGNISLAAEQLGVTRQTLYNKGKKYKLFE
jgi:transcriptional regulator of acetoin/glycerol metabolism